MRDDPVYREAMTRFAAIISEAHGLGLDDPTAMALASVGPDGRPSVRIVLMRGFDDRGIAFFTNVTSRKGRELLAHPWAAVCFHWEPLRRQIRLEGRVELLTDAESDEYWRSRRRESQIGAWASFQSATLSGRDELEARVVEFETRFSGQEVPRPDCWAGFRLIPDRIELWHGRPARLHDREVYELTDAGWTRRRLYP
jgi:pyridoxamine 5'-phosphate oxidase